ncbi:MAG: hypothetical protein RSE24_04475 [Oscillospiraceae bacterium]
MTKQTKIAAAVLGLLLVTTVVLLMLNSPSAQEKQELSKSGSFKITLDGTTKTVTMKDIEAVGISDISANYKPSGKQPVTRVYQGVSFAALLKYLELDTVALAEKNTSVVFTAIDGYTTAIKMEEALDEGKCAIVVSLENKPIGSKEDGGTGPYMMVLPQDQFSQRWCKFLGEVTFQ